MATKLTRDVARQTSRTTWQGRPLVLTLHAGSEVVTVRQAGRRTAYTISALAVFHAAAKLYAREQARLKAAARRERAALRKLGGR